MKNRITAALIALFLGGFGAHKFYLKDSGAGIFYLILFMVGASMRLPISMFLGFVDAFVLFTMSDERFDAKYNKNYDNRADRRQQRRGNRYDSREQRRYPPRDAYSNRRQQGSYQGRRDSYKRPAPAATNRPKRPRENPFKKTGISKYKEYDIDGAIEDFKKGIELDPQDMALHFNLAAAYSLTEKTDQSYYHLAKAVEHGFKDFEKIKTHDDLAFLRIQEGFEAFQENGYKLTSDAPAISTGEPAAKTQEAPEEVIKDDILLSQLQKLSELRNKGLLSEKEYVVEKEKLMRR